MLVRHLALDGSVVSIEADAADLSLPVTATGWVVVPALGQAHPFSSHPSGYADTVEATARDSGIVTFLSEDEYALRDGTLRVVVVETSGARGSDERLAVGAWDDGTWCLTTSLVGMDGAVVAEVFDSVPFSSRQLGVAVDGRVTARPRTPEVVKEIPGIGLASIRPVTSDELRRLPRSRGAAARGGEAFRATADSDALILLTETSVVDVLPLEGGDRDAMTALVGELRVEWAQRPAA